MLKTTIPFVDLRGKTPVDLMRAYPDKTQQLVKAARQSWGKLSDTMGAVALPIADRRSHNWLKRTKNPYLHEIESFADIVTTPGIYSLNLSYEWACTSGVYPTHDTITMLRVLDWPFPALGKEVMVVLQEGRGGSFYNITWPGMSGVFTAMAPGRFSASLNQAPMRKHRLTKAGDWVKNRRLAGRENGLPPAHLLRQVMEQADTYHTAKYMLTKTPVSSPVIFVLGGLWPGEGCIIERLENAAEVIELPKNRPITAANHFTSVFANFENGWRPRGIDSAGRYRQSCTFGEGELYAPDFNWLSPPMLNSLTRLCVVCDPATGRLMVQGFEGVWAVTDLFNLPIANYDVEREAI